MVTFNSDFLNRVREQKELTNPQFAALEAMCGCDGDAEKAADKLFITASAVKSRMTQVYSRFGLGGKGRDKFLRLKNKLLEMQQRGVGSEVEQTASLPDVEELRSRVKADIKRRCGTMRVLDMERPIELGTIYTEVNVLEKLTANQRCSQQELIEQITGGNSPDNFSFDRFGLGRVRQKRVPGLEAVERNRALMVLGKPGAGKTTFLKYLAIACLSGDFMGDRIPIFVTLKEFAEADGQPSLLEFIATQWSDCDVEDANKLVEKYLKAGQGLVLLDGLDEVRFEDNDRVIKEIKRLGDRYAASKLIVTCRIAAREYIFERFVEVEVSDFGDEEIREFTTNWFTAKNDIPKIEALIKELHEQKPVKELASSPLLLTLLCLVFGEAGKLPGNRSRLYKEGIDLLLSKWDGKRNIQRETIYENLSNQRKEDLLGQLALATFERGEYFFRQDVAEIHITDYIQNLPGAQEDTEALQLDSKKVLRAIESQHGLLVERARGIYSSSHLTFHEYFTAQEISNRQSWEILSTNLNYSRWREVVLLTVSSLSEGTGLVRHLKDYIDQLIANDTTLQACLQLTASKAEKMKIPYKKMALRALYLRIAMGLPGSVGAFDVTLQDSFDVDLDYCIYVDRALDNEIDLDFSIELVLLQVMRFEGALLNRNPYDVNLADAIHTSISLACIRASTAGYSELRTKLTELNYEIRSLEQSWLQADQISWWNMYGFEWTEKFRSLSIEYRDIGHDWCFTNRQKQRLEQYYDANRLLAECLNSDCYITRDTRQELEETLLLPITEIERYKAESS